MTTIYMAKLKLDSRSLRRLESFQTVNKLFVWTIDGDLKAPVRRVLSD